MVIAKSMELMFLTPSERVGLEKAQRNQGKMLIHPVKCPIKGKSDLLVYTMLYKLLRNMVLRSNDHSDLVQIQLSNPKIGSLF